MDEPKLSIAPKKYTEESQIISMRIPKDMLRAIDEAAQKAGRTRNEILTLGIDFALQHMEITDTKEQ